MHWIGIIFASIILIIDLIFFLSSEDLNLFYFLLGIGFAIIITPFILSLSLENKKELQINSMFLEFSRNLAESVNTGTPVSKSIVNMKRKNYGPLSIHIEKLANQIELGIPLSRALENFSYDVDSNVIRRAVELIKEAEKSGGEIDYILESVAKSIAEVEKLKKERKAAIYNLIVQGYIIFFIFIGIMLVMEFKIIPLTTGISGISDFGSGVDSIGVESGSDLKSEDVTKHFLLLLIAQGFFAGLSIGKLSEGSVKAGLKHSFILMTAAFLISTGSRVIIS